MKVVDLVVIVEEGVRDSWIRGKIVRVSPGKDGRSQAVDVQTVNCGGKIPASS